MISIRTLKSSIPIFITETGPIIMDHELKYRKFQIL